MSRKRCWNEDQSGTDLPLPTKRVHYDPRDLLSHESYTIAWICALSIEMAAARAMLDDVHEGLPQDFNDSNSYVLGSIGQHNVVIACLPNGEYGSNNAAITFTNLRRTFKYIQLGLMVGIGGGAPSKVDLRLGDIVVGSRVTQHDLGKTCADGQFNRTSISRVVSPSISTVVSNLRSNHQSNSSRVPSILREKSEGLRGFERPTSTDRLFSATYQHDSSTPDCTNCDQSKLKQRPLRDSNDPVIHYGAIASGNQVIKDSQARDRLANDLGVICFEMETSGLMDICPCLPVRGICDYSDSHKADEWQKYAAAAAAAYAREFLEELAVFKGFSQPPSSSNRRHHISSAYRKSLLLESLYFYQMDARKTEIKQACSKTCQWLTKLPEYETWLHGHNQAQHHGLMWLIGKPGAGKSTIMKFIYLEKKERQHDEQLDPTLTASFFFNARGTTLNKSVTGMFRSLILQLLEGFPDLKEVLDDSDIVSRDQRDCPSLNVLKNIFSGAVSKIGSRSFTCFIDALDESDEQQLIDTVQYFEGLAESCTEKRIQFQVCLSSRHYPHLEFRRGIRLILENQPGHRDDLDTYIRNKLQITNPVLLEDLLPQLLKKSAGIFLWVVLVINILNREYQSGGLALRRRLADVPEGLSELFRDILKRDNENMEGLLLAVLWLLYSHHPLTPLEYYHALWSGLALKDLADPEVPDATGPHAIAWADRYVINSSKGLVEVTKSSRTVQFIHESVRDFLVKDGGLLELWPDHGLDLDSLSHERLKECCNSYINNPDVLNSVKASTELNASSMAQVDVSCPFLRYASQRVLYHANLAAAVIPQDGFLSQFLLPRGICRPTPHGYFMIHQYQYDSFLWILAEEGFSTLILMFLEGMPYRDITKGSQNNPLWAALAQAHKKAAAALLGLSSNIIDDIDMFEDLVASKDSKVFQERTPLTWAVSNGYEHLARHLILEGAPVDEIDAGQRSPLTLASQSANVAVASFLIEKGANVNTPDGMNITPLAVVSGEAMARLLIDSRADILATYKTTGYLFMDTFCRLGLETVIKSLFERGVNVNTPICPGHELSTIFSTPLHLASQYSREMVARFLIKSGAGIDSLDDGQRTPLHIASQYGQEAIARLLIKKGADINSQSSLGTPLHMALEQSDKAMVEKGKKVIARLLIEEGADINAPDHNGLLPLDVARSRGLRDITKLLVRMGARRRVTRGERRV